MSKTTEPKPAGPRKPQLLDDAALDQVTGGGSSGGSTGKGDGADTVTGGTSPGFKPFAAM
jgi:hypothetical protein